MIGNGEEFAIVVLRRIVGAADDCRRCNRRHEGAACDGGRDCLADLHRILLQADACAGILPLPRLRGADPPSRSAYIVVTAATVVGRHLTASQKMLSVSAESLVFRIIY